MYPASAYRLAGAKAPFNRQALRRQLSEVRRQGAAELHEHGEFRRQSEMRAAISFNGRARPVYWVNQRVRDALSTYFVTRLKLGHGVTAWRSRWRGLVHLGPVFLTNDGRPFALLRVAAPDDPQATRPGRDRGRWNPVRASHVRRAPEARRLRPSPYPRGAGAGYALGRKGALRGRSGRPGPHRCHGSIASI